MAATFVNRAKGSLGEAIIYKVFYPSVEGAVARRLLQLFYFALAAPWFIAWWGLFRYAKMAYFFVSGNTFELDYKGILAPLALKGVDLSNYSADFNDFFLRGSKCSPQSCSDFVQTSRAPILQTMDVRWSTWVQMSAKKQQHIKSLGRGF